MNCPICSRELVKTDSDYPNYPNFSCPCNDYQKYFFSSWSASHYIETAKFDNYRVSNITNRRDNKPDIGRIEELLFNEKAFVKFKKLFEFPHVIKIPQNKQELLDQIDTYKLFI